MLFVNARPGTSGASQPFCLLRLNYAAPVKILLACLTLNLLVSCGDGGGGGESSNPAPFAQHEVARIVVTPSSIMLSGLNDKQTLSAQAYNAAGEPIEVDFNWSSSAAGTVSVDGDGNAIARDSIGFAQLLASAEDIDSQAVQAIVAPAATGRAEPITVPFGLGPGTKYRLAFVTSAVRDATSSDIADYNSFITTVADSVCSLAELGATWRAIGSTAAVDARNNTNTNPSNDIGVPIYLLNGQLLAKNNQDLWDGSQDPEDATLKIRFNVTESGLETSSTPTWTGTSMSGVPLTGGVLGSESVGTGSTASAAIDWFYSTETHAPTHQLPLYAISSVLVVPELQFLNGVAAGDVDQDSVVLWARAASGGEVEFQIGNHDFSTIAATPAPVRVTDTDIPVKVKVEGLEPGTEYSYRACVGQCSPAPVCNAAVRGEASGKFRTPHETDRRGLSFGATSCFDTQLKPFASIQNAPAQGLDFFVMLGDNIYGTDGKRLQDIKGAISVQDFRNRYKQTYSPRLTEPDPERTPLMELRASTALYATIDDHDVRDNFAGGARPDGDFCWDANSQDRCDDKDYVNDTRTYKNALRAFTEYLPVAEETYGRRGGTLTEDKPKLYRYRTFGTDAAIMLLDARSFRDKPAELDGKMLSYVQREELQKNLLDAHARGIVWKFVLVSVPIFEMGPYDFEKFASYPLERDEILEFIEDRGIDNVVFVSGDIHGNLVNNLVYKERRVGRKVGSRSWDISTGPAAHEPTIANQLYEKRLKASPILRKKYDEGNRKEKDQVLEEVLNRDFGTDPQIGLCGPGVPATLLRGSYTNLHTNGWTQFDIDADTQVLTATTYGVDVYGGNLGGSDTKTFLKDNYPKIINRFEVKPRFAGNIGPSTPNTQACDAGPANTRPVANAGADQTLECTSAEGATARLDGTASYDPNRDPIEEYLWTDSAGNADGPIPRRIFPIGTDTASLVTYDDRGAASDPDTVQITVADTTAPEVALMAEPAILWPPNHKLMPVRIQADVADTCDDEPVCRITGVTSSEGSGEQGDWRIDGDLSLSLRAERDGNGPGRTYTIGVSCMDWTGNTTKTQTQVVVPHDQ